MDHRQARKTGWTIIGCGCVIILTKLWLGLAMAALGLLLIALGGRCPHCGKILFFLPANAFQPVPQVPRPPVSGPAGVPPQGESTTEEQQEYGKKKII